jgi:hypothetical protein
MAAARRSAEDAF